MLTLASFNDTNRRYSRSGYNNPNTRHPFYQITYQTTSSDCAWMGVMIVLFSILVKLFKVKNGGESKSLECFGQQVAEFITGV